MIWGQKSAIKFLLRESLLNEAQYSINALIKAGSKIRKERKKAWGKYFDLDTKFSNAQVKLKMQEKDLQDQRDRIMSDMENDPDVVANLNIGDKGAVANYAKELHKVEKKQRQLEATRDRYKTAIMDARKEYEQLKRKELIINDSTMKALGKK